jgi:hypothetical protein
MRESTEDEARRGRAEVEHEARTNQQRHEPMPASHQAGDDRSAVDRNKEHSAAQPDQPERPTAAGEGDAVRASQPERPSAAGEGDAVRAMMGGPTPQGDVPDAPATQIAGVDSENGQVTRVSRVANAVPGKPDGEVDTRS